MNKGGRNCRNGRVAESESIRGDTNKRTSNFTPTSTHKPAANTAPTSAAKRLPLTSKEIGIVLLVLASHTISSVSGMDGILSTELISDAFAYNGRPYARSDGSYYSDFYSSTHAEESKLQFADLSDGVTSSPSQSDGRYDEEDEEELRKFLCSRFSTPRPGSELEGEEKDQAYQFAHDEEVWERVLSFLPWQSALRLRGTNRTIFRQSISAASVLRMPHTKKPATFIPVHSDFLAEEAEAVAALRPTCDQWQCSQCGQLRKTLVCGSCPPRDDLHRLFFGQLRRSGTVPMVKWLVEDVLGAAPGSLVAVENHLDLHTHRGKGCAWVTVRGADTAQRLLSMHHRLFFDVVEGVEGVWMAQPGEEATLAAEAGGRHRPASMKHMPRKCLVVERASSSPAVVVPATSVMQPRSHANAHSSGAGSTNARRSPSGTEDRWHAHGGYGWSPVYQGDSYVNNVYSQWKPSGAAAEDWAAYNGQVYNEKAAYAWNEVNQMEHTAPMYPYADREQGIVHVAPGFWRHDPYLM